MGGSRIDLLLFLNIPVLFSTITFLRHCCLDLSRGQDKTVSLNDLEFLQPLPSAGLVFRAGCARLPSKRRAWSLTGLTVSICSPCSSDALLQKLYMEEGQLLRSAILVNFYLEQQYFYFLRLQQDHCHVNASVHASL